MTKELAFEEYKKDTGYKNLSAVSAIACFYAGYDSGNKEIIEILTYLFTLGDLPNCPVEVFLKKWRDNK